ncbi:MAG: type I-E CRISPR-associated protein Cas7/Cse4/CasC [Geobacteraceae bacterium]|nr:type I-E CRISPR-associated protein Cas7/Cse4/CasC [Geobacteraceae bacterium]
MKTIVEIHALQNFAPSNLNRDDTGAPKDALFGGTRRARVSSQCLKRSIRQFFKMKVEEKEFLLENLGQRTKRLLDEVVKLLVKEGRDQEEARKRARLAVLAGAGIWVAPNDEENNEDEKSEYLMFLGTKEIAAVVATINERWNSEKWEAIEEALKKGSAKEKKKEAAKKASKELKESFSQILNGGKAVDVALFGRMLADMPERNQNAACQVAHSISTHSVEREFDFYTAVDDLKPEDSAGADMMGTVEFNSACFYRYAVVDWEKLVENLQNDRELAAKGLRAFLEGFVVAEPTGKQNTFAAHNPPEFVAVTVRRNAAPRNLANAFETPIRVKKDESLTRKSAEELAKKAQTLQVAFGGEEQTFVLNLIEAKMNGLGTTLPALKDLLDKALSAVQE